MEEGIPETPESCEGRGSGKVSAADMGLLNPSDVATDSIYMDRPVS